MAPSKLRKALGAVKDKTSIGLAKVGGTSGAASSELEVAIVKATKHDESFPADERHIREILALTRRSCAYASACVASLSRRLGRTRSWDVALKTLVIVHRLLSDGEPTFEQELFYATRRGTRMLNMSDFCGRISEDAWDFTAFVRTYAAYLDDRLECRMQARHGGASRSKVLLDELYRSPSNRFICDGANENRREDAAADADAAAAAKAVALVPRDTPTSEMTLEQLLGKVHQLQHLLDRFNACRPAGAARASRVVTVSLFPLVKESVQLYCELTEVMAALTEQFPGMETADCERVYGVFCGLVKELDELDSFYAWCKDAYVCRESDVPEVELITQKKLELMDDFILDRRVAESEQRLPPPSPEPPSPEPEADEYDMNTTRALPAPTEQPDGVQEAHTAGEASVAELEMPLIIADVVDEEADFLNLKADAMSGEEHGQQLALALFDGNPAGSAPTSDLFDTSSADWETALVESASALANQRAALGGGLNMMVLDGMYNHAAAANTQVFSGSTSSEALRPPGTPMLALPTPPGMCSATAGADPPFAASMVVPPPTYVQMSDMQTKQQLLTEEQMMWQHYGKNGMQGQGAAMLEQRPPGVYHRAS